MNNKSIFNKLLLLKYFQARGHTHRIFLKGKGLKKNFILINFLYFFLSHNTVN